MVEANSSRRQRTSPSGPTSATTISSFSTRPPVCGQRRTAWGTRTRTSAFPGRPPAGLGARGAAQRAGAVRARHSAGAVSSGAAAIGYDAGVRSGAGLVAVSAEHRRAANATTAGLLSHIPRKGAVGVRAAGDGAGVLDAEHLVSEVRAAVRVDLLPES